MKRKIISLLLLVLMCSVSIVSAESDAEDEVTLKLLTLNLLFSEPTTSFSSDNIPRFSSIADFILDKDIDCVLCQEVVGGGLAKKLGLTQTINSSLDLKSDLNLLGLDYSLTYRLANGIPLLFSVGNAVFCKKSVDIMWTISQTLSFASEITINGLDVKLRRIIMGCLLRVPGFGKLLLFNTHLCSFCPSEQRQVQIEEALEFIKKVRYWVRLIYGKVPVVLAGDFNTHDTYPMFSVDPLYEYNLITKAGFVDAYADYTGCDFGNNCCISEDDPSIVESGCTYAVDNNPFENDPNQTTRIDYFFLKELEAVLAYVVFDGTEKNGPFVSDHSGVVVELPFPNS